jgi:hypothetical protein
MQSFPVNGINNLNCSEKENLPEFREKQRDERNEQKHKSESKIGNNSLKESIHKEQVKIIKRTHI